MTNARRELKHAVERFAEIDPREGHVTEAARLAREVRDEASRLMQAVEGNDGTA
jgi:hypothetical protein